MRIVNFGSLNIDHFYPVPHFVAPGETLSTAGYRTAAGGKGANQSIALVRAGTQVLHAGKVGRDGLWLKETLDAEGIDTSLIKISSEATGHAIIQITPEGENSILVHAGANADINQEFIDEVLSSVRTGDLLLLQNEIGEISQILTKAKSRGLRVAMNFAPCSEVIHNFPLEHLEYLILNEVEVCQLSAESHIENATKALAARYPQVALVVTLGADGAFCIDQGKRYSVTAPKVTAVDTTAAGDTFVGYFLHARSLNLDLEQSLTQAVLAASVSVTRYGAIASIPRAFELASCEK